MPEHGDGVPQNLRPLRFIAAGKGQDGQFPIGKQFLIPPDDRVKDLVQFVPVSGADTLPYSGQNDLFQKMWHGNPFLHFTERLARANLQDAHFFKLRC